MRVKEILTTYQSKVPFPWSIQKIKAAGYEPTELFLSIGRDLEKCTDNKTKRCARVMETIGELKKLV